MRPSRSPLDEALTARSSSEPSTQLETYRDGTPACTLFRPGLIDWQASYPAVTGFLDAPSLVGYDFQGPVYRGEEVDLPAYSELSDGMAVLPKERS